MAVKVFDPDTKTYKELRPIPETVAAPSEPAPSARSGREMSAESMRRQLACTSGRGAEYRLDQMRRAETKPDPAEPIGVASMQRELARQGLTPRA